MRAVWTVMGIAALVFCGTAGAACVDFQMGPGSSIDTSATASALEMWATVYPSVALESFGLNVGESHSFLFAQMGTNEDWINSDDLVPAAVAAQLDFTLPSVDGDVNGQTTGFIGGFLGSDQGWDVVWTDPVLVNFGNGGLFSVELSDASFRSGLWSGPDGWCDDGYANICATVTLLACPQTPPPPLDPVPEPATLSLLGIGLAGIALRRKFVA